MKKIKFRFDDNDKKDKRVVNMAYLANCICDACVEKDMKHEDIVRGICIAIYALSFEIKHDLVYDLVQNFIKTNTKLEDYIEKQNKVPLS